LAAKAARWFVGAALVQEQQRCAQIRFKRQEGMLHHLHAPLGLDGGEDPVHAIQRSA